MTLLPAGIVTGNTASLHKKISSFKRAGAADIHIVFDFDRTLTVNHHTTQKEVTSWHILHEHLPPEGKRRYTELFEIYRPLELAGSLSPQNAADWWSAILDLYVLHKLDMRAVERSFLEAASIRPSATELFDLCAVHNIPTIIMSAGTREIINLWVRAYDVKPSLVLATALQVNSRGKIVGWHKNTLIHALNKHEVGHEQLSAIRKQRPKVIVVGDSMNDANMAAGQEDVLRLRVFDPRPDEPLDAARQQTFSRFDAMIESGDFVPLLQLVHMLVG